MGPGKPGVMEFDSRVMAKSFVQLVDNDYARQFAGV